MLDQGAHRRHLANTIEPSMCDGDEAFLTNYFDHLLFSIIYFTPDSKDPGG